MKSIKTKLIVAIAVLTALSSGIFCVVSVIQSSKALTEHVHSHLETAANDSERTLNAIVVSRMSYVLTIAEQEYLINQNHTMKEKSIFLRDFVKKSSTFMGFVYIDLKGKAVSTLDDTYDFNSRDWYKRLVKTDSPVVSIPWFNPVLNDLVYTYAAPVKNERGNTVGYVAGNRSASSSSALFAKTTIGKTGGIWVIDNKTGIVTITGREEQTPILENYEDLDSTFSGYKATIDMIRETKSNGLTSYVHDGKKKLVAYAYFAYLDWSMIANVPEFEVMTAVKSLRTQLILIAIIIVVLGIILAYFLSQSISKPMQIMQKMVYRMREGDLTKKIISSEDKEKIQKRQDEIGNMGKALSDTVEKLSEIVSKVQYGSTEVASASEQLASANQDLSQRTEQQASALEETSAAIEEMTTSIKASGDNIQTAGSLSENAVKQAKEGEESIKQVLVSMDSINESSNKIADIIGVINNIAFQTNLLALNASIEAARAGEHGKGFAVVAVEVRKLAKNSEKAAKEIENLIRDSSTRVDEGVEIAQKAGDVLTGILKAIDNINSVAAEIGAASSEQIGSVSQIDSTLSNLDENTQKNAAMVEEQASATEQLSAQAQELKTTMEFFKIDVTDTTAKKKKLIAPPKKTVETSKKISTAIQKKEIPTTPMKKNFFSNGSTENAIKTKKTEAINTQPQMNKQKPLSADRAPAIDDSYELFSELADNGDFSEF